MKPFFSVIIPTYNRPGNIKQAIESILNQTFRNYEIVITDNSTNLLSKTICESYKNENIRYFKNKENLGFTKNLYKCINLAKGKYIFILGDDDLLLERELLANIHKLTIKNKYGYIRIKFIYHKAFKKLFSVYLNDALDKNLRMIKPNSNEIDIYNFIDRSIYSFISGLVFLNTRNFTIKEIGSNKKEDIDLSNFWIKYLFNIVKSHGGYIDINNTILSQWPEYPNPVFYNVIDNKIPEERIWELYKEYVDQATLKTIIHDYTTIIVRNFPSIKYYSNTGNLVLFARRLVQLNPTLLYNLSFYFFFLSSLIIPKKNWSFIRSLYQGNKQITDLKTRKSLSLLLSSFR